MAILTKPDGTFVEVEPKNGINFILDELLDHLECTMIEISRGTNGNIIVSDEEGLCRGDIVKHPIFGLAIENENGEYQPYLNRLATRSMHPDLGPFVHNAIVGNAIICKDKEVN
jgi:hypothetical protein